MSEQIEQKAVDTGRNPIGDDTRVEFTKEMRKDYTILIPDMLPVHFKLLRNIFTQRWISCRFAEEYRKTGSRHRS